MYIQSEGVRSGGAVCAIYDASIDHVAVMQSEYHCGKGTADNVGFWTTEEPEHGQHTTQDYVVQGVAGGRRHLEGQAPTRENEQHFLLLLTQTTCAAPRRCFAMLCCADNRSVWCCVET